MRVTKSAYYSWKTRPTELISANDLHLSRRVKTLFSASRESLGVRELVKKLRVEDFDVRRYRASRLMVQLGLEAKQRAAYKVTTMGKHSDSVADNLLNQNFDPVGPNQIWAGDITYLKTGEGWMYLAAVMDLYSRRIVGWSISKRMTTDLIMRAMIKAYNIRRPLKCLVFHNDRGSQYTRTSQAFT